VLTGPAWINSGKSAFKHKLAVVVVVVVSSSKPTITCILCVLPDVQRLDVAD